VANLTAWLLISKNCRTGKFPFYSIYHDGWTLKFQTKFFTPLVEFVFFNRNLFSKNKNSFQKIVGDAKNIGSAEADFFERILDTQRFVDPTSGVCFSLVFFRKRLSQNLLAIKKRVSESRFLERILDTSNIIYIFLLSKIFVKTFFIGEKMNLRILKDKELLEQTKNVAQSEREILTKMLHHLREINRRKLFSDLGYQSLFEYAVKELKYSEGQAGRRIQAMRLIHEIPEVEEKIESGNLNLINVSQVQSLFREAKRASILVSKSDKLNILQKLENKSKLEGQKIIENMRPVLNLKPKLDDKTEISLSDETKNKFSELRSLLGYEGSQMSFTELIDFMADHTIESLKIKKFGKKRVLSDSQPVKTQEKLRTSPLVSTPPVESPMISRQIPRHIKFAVWTRDRGKCKKCGGSSNLNYDHIQPAALGGGSTLENLRLLCFSCNQRRAIKTFGLRADCEKRCN
jgi:hypothetical protein